MTKNKFVYERKQTFYDAPLWSLMLMMIGFVIIIFSIVNLQNPFFIVTGTFAGFVFIFWSYDYWQKRLVDFQLKSLRIRVAVLESRRKI